MAESTSRDYDNDILGVTQKVPVRVAIRSQKESAICCRQKSQWQLAWLVALEPSPWVPALNFQFTRWWWFGVGLRQACNGSDRFVAVDFS
ncbi:hypothetical protein J7297_00708 [Nakaseomyces glabratus]|nr:hypothetical protein J7297_00708 [Nakaseomyces glabratus]KAH7596535.1 hypothetical protein J7296_00705 [Nakaseomyces glabratus]